MDLAGEDKGGWLVWFLRGVLVLLFLFLVARLVELQIIKGRYYRDLSDGNRIRKIILPSPRGRILARGGEVLVGNREIEKKVEFGEVITVYERNYNLGSGFAHVSGYLGQASEEEVGKIDPKCPEKGPWRPGDWVGRGGLEEQYNCSLRGTPGEELVEVDIKGNLVRVLGKKEPTPGVDLRTNIDFGLQSYLPGLFENKKGVVVMTDTKGQVLAFYSSPSFNPEKVASFLQDPNLALFDRAISGLYHPGSVFKPVVAIAALEEGKINQNFRFTDPGVIRIGSYSYANWYFTRYGRTEGEIDITRAIARSTDTFFYKIGEMVGIEKIAEYADKFGLNRVTGIDLPGEAGGLIPTPEWKKTTQGTNWFLGNTYHVAIGQGDVAVTPIEINQMISAIAAGGRLCQPRVAVGEENCRDLGIKKEILDLVKEGMVKVCSSGGTGYTFFDLNSGSTKLTTTNRGLVACKTGTAETNQDGKTHAWFTLFTPAGEPETVVTVLFEGGGEGSKVAGPVARKIYDQIESLR